MSEPASDLDVIEDALYDVWLGEAEATAAVKLTAKEALDRMRDRIQELERERDEAREQVELTDKTWLENDALSEEHVIKPLQAERDTLQARIDLVQALVPKWEARSDYWRSQPYPPPKELTVLQENLAKELRAALAAPIGSTERSTRANIPNDGHDDVDDMSDWPDADATGSGEPEGSG